MRERTYAEDPSQARIDFGHVGWAVMVRLPRILLVTLVLCAIAYGVVQFMPRLYESQASLLAEPRSNIYTQSTVDRGNTQYLVDDAQVSSQIALIASRAVLLEAVERGDLRQDLAGGEPGLLGRLIQIVTGPSEQGASDEAVLETLRDGLSVARERDSRLFTVAYRATDPQLAARVANAIAEAHVQARAGQQLSDTASATQWLEEEIARLRESVSEAEARVAEFRVENDLYSGNNDTSITDQQLSNYSNQIAAATERRGAAEARAERIQRMLDNGESVLGLEEVQASPVIQNLSEELSRLQSLRAERSSTYLSNHPQIRSLDEQIANVTAQIEREARSVANSLASQAEIEGELEQSLRDEMARAEGEAGNATRNGVTLAELEREAAAQRDLLNAYLIRYREAASRTQNNSALPDVRIVSEAAPSSNPVSPRPLLILVALAAVSIVFQVAAIIFAELLSGRALGAAPQPAPRSAARSMSASMSASMALAPLETQVPETVQEADDRMPFAPIAPETIEMIDVGPYAESDQALLAAEDDFAYDIEDDEVDGYLAGIVAAAARGDTATPTPYEDTQEGEQTMADHSPAPDIGPEGPSLLAMIAAMPLGYGVYAPETLSHGFPVPRPDPAANKSAAFEPEHRAPQSQVAETAERDAPQAWAADEDGFAHDAATPDAPEIDPDAPALESVVLSYAASEPEHGDIEAEIDQLAERMMVAGGERILVIAATTAWEDSCLVAEKLGERLLAAGVSVCELDAASARVSEEEGLSDLSVGETEFGDVVHRGENPNFAFVPWGRHTAIDRRSHGIATLAEAVSEVYETVIVVTGRLGMASLISAFADLDAGCAVVTEDGVVPAGAREDLAALGYTRLTTLSFDARKTEVA